MELNADRSDGDRHRRRASAWRWRACAELRRKSKAVILLTDGDNNGGKIAPEYAAHLANAVGARLYTIQIGQGEEAEVAGRRRPLRAAPLRRACTSR